MVTLQRSHMKVLVRVRRTLRAAGELLAFIWAGVSAVGRVLIGRWPEPYKASPDLKGEPAPAPFE